MSEGKKFDGEKPPMQLIPYRAMVEVARVLQFGAKKYDAHNWRKGIQFSRLIGACERHLGAFKDGEDLDQETQLSHVAHLVCEAVFLMQFICEERQDLDDRYRPETPDILVLGKAPEPNQALKDLLAPKDFWPGDTVTSAVHGTLTVAPLEANKEANYFGAIVLLSDGYYHFKKDLTLVRRGGK